jgi:hypothetical protein
MHSTLIKSFYKVPRAQEEAPWFGRSQCDKQQKKQGVCHIVALPITLKSILRQKNQIFHHEKI